jgi:Cu2+-exporting ATPase
MAKSSRVSNVANASSAEQTATQPHERSLRCYHCGLPVPAGVDITVAIGGELRSMCCPGCAAVACAIVAGGLADFYRHRTHPAPTMYERARTPGWQAEAYDDPEVQKDVVRTHAGNLREAALIIEGIVCAACVWLNERHLKALPGVLDVQINYTTHRTRVTWDDARVHLSEIIRAIGDIGYRAHPYDPNRQEQLLQRARRQQLRRVGVAGALGMQVMILAVALYGGAWSGMEPEFRNLFRWLSLALAAPVVAYCALPFFHGAWRDLKNRRLGMDAPVALGIGSAFGASVAATVSDVGQVYYDSVVMFVFFLLTARYFELSARKRAAEASEVLAQRNPGMATRLRERSGGRSEERVPVARLVPGDRVLVRPGETVPADGCVLEGRSSVDESLLSGESVPRPKSTGGTLVGGTINIESPLVVQVEKVGQDTRLAAIARLLARAQSEKPRVARLADRAASWFVGAVLVLAAGVAVYWWQNDPAHWLTITIAVLVVTCPCALSLATPTAITAATGALTRLGLLPTRGDALERLAHATHFVFDKTGTLTTGRVRLIETHALSDLDARACLLIARALEQRSEHPIARALLKASDDDTPAVSDVSTVPAAGVCGDIDGERYAIGSPRFIEAHTGLRLPAERLARLRRDDRSVVLLATNKALCAAFVLIDEIRPGAHALIERLQRLGKHVWLLTGDHAQTACALAQALGIGELAWELTPEEKLERVRALQQQGAIVAMVGDGVNDAPVLAQAHISIAMGSGTELAAASADMILLSEQLPHLALGVDTARKTLRIIRQNLGWAVLYNVIALPAAAAGWVTPWMAALGMSASSLLVVANALRLVDKRANVRGKELPRPAHARL